MSVTSRGENQRSVVASSAGSLQSGLRRLVPLLLLLALAAPLSAATLTMDTSGDIAVGANYVEEVAPSPGDDVVINEGVDATVNNDFTVDSITLNGASGAAGATLTILNGAILTINGGDSGGNAITIGSGGSATPTRIDVQDGQINALGGDIQIAGGGLTPSILQATVGTIRTATIFLTLANSQIDFSSGDAFLEVNEDITGAGSFTAGALSTVVFNGGATAQTFNLVPATTFANLTVNQASLNGLMVASVITVNGKLDINTGLMRIDSGLNAGTSSTLEMGPSTKLQLGRSTVSTPVAMPSFNTYTLDPTSTIAYDANAAQSVNGSVPYQNLSFTGGGALPMKSFTSNASIAGTMTVGPSVNVNLGAGVITVGVSVTGTGSLSAGSGDLQITSLFSHTGSWFPGTGTVTYLGNGSSTARGGITYNNLVFSQTAPIGTRHFTANTTVVGSLTLNDGANVDLNSSVMTVAGSVLLNDALNDGTLSMTGTSAVLDGDGMLGAALTVGVGANVTVPATANLWFFGNTLLNIGSTLTNNGVINSDASFNGTGALTNGANAFLSVFSAMNVPLDASAAGNTVVYDGDGIQTVATPTGNEYHHLTLSATSFATTKDTLASLNINGDLTLAGGLPSVTFDPFDDLVVGGNVNLNSGSTFNPASFLSVKGNWNNLGATFNPGTSIVQFDGLAPQSIDATPFFNVLFDNSAKTLDGAITVLGDLDITSDAALNGGAFSHLVAGNWGQASTGAFNPATSTVTFNGALNQTIDATTFHNLVIANTAGMVALSGAVSVAGFFNVNDGIFDVGSESVDVNGNLVVAGAGSFNVNTGSVFLAGNVQTDGLMSALTGSVTVDGTAVQSWSGSTPPSLHNLTVDNNTGSLNPSVTLNVNGFLTLTNGAIVTSGTAAINVASTGIINRTNGWVDGRLNQTHAGGGAKVYPFGTTLGYAPATVTIGAGGQLDLEIFDVAHPNKTGTNVLNSYWTIHSTSNVAGPVDLQFQYQELDVTGAESSYVPGRYAGGGWSQPAGSVTAATNAITVSTISPYTGDWTAGEAAALGGVAYFDVTVAPAAIVAGTTSTLTITAKDVADGTVTGFAGTQTLLFGGANAAPDSTLPHAIDNTSTPIDFGLNTSVTFIAGVATVDVRLFAAELADVTVTQGSVSGMGTIDVDAAAASALALISLNGGGTLYANAPFDVALDTVDAWGNTAEVAAATDVTLSVVSGTGTLGGLITATIPAASSGLTFSDVTYNVAEAMTIGVTDSSASPTLTGVTIPATFTAQIGGLVVTTSADSGAGSLREAITRINTGECGTPCNLTFNITPAGPHTITLLTLLPDVLLPTVFDASTQPGYAGTPLIRVEAPGLSEILLLAHNGSTVRGFAFGNASGEAVLLYGNNHVVEDCWIGLDVTGTLPSATAVGIVAKGNNNTIQDNVVSGNGTGIELSDTATNNIVRRNLIGTSVDGDTSVGNAIGLRLIGGATSNTIGGGSTGDRNVISGNSGAGVSLVGTAIIIVDVTSTVDFGGVTSHAAGVVELNVIENNLIGLQIDGSTPLGNGSGVLIGTSTSGNIIRNNTIANNGTAGVAAANGAANVFTTNSIYDNGDLGIDLGNDGATVNDVDDVDSGANGLQNFPVVTSATLDSFGNAVVAYSMDGPATAGSIGVEFFEADSLASGEGRTFVASQCTAGNGFVTSATFAAGPLTVGDVLVATATSYSDASCGTVVDGTSEFSAGAMVAACTTPTPTITASGPTTFCAGGSVVLTASNADSWLWSTSETTQSITVSAGGSYSVTATTAGCSATSAATTVTVTPMPTATITPSGPTTFCDGGSVTLTASNGDSFLWSTGATTQSITVSAGGSYTVDVTVSGCTASSSPTNVTVNPLPTVTITGPSSMCDGGTVTLDAGPGFSSYAWSNGATSQTITVNPTSTSTYTVTVIDGNSCSNSASHTVTVAAPPAPVITGPSSMCEGAIITLDAGAGYASYLWSTGATTQTISVSPASTTTYTVTVSDGACNGNTSHTVTVTPAPVATITPGGPTTFCDGGSVTLTASNGDSYLWSTGATTQSITVSAAGSYSVDVTASGCTATSASVPVTVSPNPVATITASGPTAICDGDSVTLTASAGDSWLWSNGATSQSITVSTAGSYSVTVTTGSCNNTSAATNVTVNPAPTATLAAPSTVCASSSGNAASVDAQAGATYAWTIANGVITSGDGTPSIEFTAGSSGTLTLSVTVSVGSCSASDSVALSLSPAPVVNIAAPAESEPDATHAASVVPQAGATWSWTIANGTILTGASTNAITFKAGPSGQTTLFVEATLGSCTKTDSHVVNIGTPGPTAADLSITKTAPASVVAGSQFVYVLAARNDGPDDAMVVVSDVLPAGTSFVRVASTLTCSDSGNEVSCSGFVQSGTTRQITLTVNAPATAGTITNTATIFSFVADPDSTDNSASVSTNVHAATANCPTVVPTPLAPSGVTVSSPVTFSWTASNVATDYEVWVASGSIASRAGITSATSLTVALPPGAIEWYVVARSEGCTPLESARSLATVSEASDCGAPPRPQLTSPRNSSVSGPEVTFSWTASPGAIGYRVWAEVNNTAAQDLGTTDGTTTTFTTVLPAGEMVVYVEALFSACPSARSTSVAFRVAPPDPCGARTEALPMIPANGTTFASSVVQFQWGPANEPDGYRVWFRHDGGTPEVLGTTVDETTLAIALESGAYEWWIESLYDGCASTESDHREFVIPQRSVCSAPAPALLEPANGASLANGIVTFRWTAVPDARRYEVWLSVDRGTPSLVGESETTSLTVEVAEGAIEWFVRAIVDRCPTVQSQEFDFALLVPDACDGNNRPVTVSPVSRSLVTAPFDCVWTPVEGATHYELFVRRGGEDAVSAGTTHATRMDDVELPNGNVRWFVRAHFANCPPRDSAEEKLEVVPETASCGTLDVPMIAAVAQVSSDIPFLIQWRPSPGATLYQLQVADNAQFSGAQTFNARDAWHELTRTNVSGAATPIFARVRAIDERCPRNNFSPFGLTAVIYVLPFEGNEGATPPGNGLVSHTIALGAELAGQSFVVSLKEPWLSASPMSGVVGSAGTEILITADTTGLPFGSSLGSVTVTLTSAARGITTHATSIKPAAISISKITPVTPTPKSTPPPDALIIPAVAHANGFNSQFQSDVRVTNSSAQLINYQLTFTPSGDSGIATGRQTNFAIEAGKTVALDDVLRTWFGTGSESVTGTLEVRPLTQTAAATSNAALSGLSNLVTFASSRTFNTTANGTFGQHIPAIPYANFIGGVVNGAPSKILSLQQIAQSDRYRTNLGIVEGSGEPVSLLVKVFGETGQRLVEFPLNLAGGQHAQLNSFLAQRGITSLNDGRVEISVTSPAGKVTAYASVLDNATSDPLLVSPISLSDAGANKWVVPGVADLNSNGANWRTDMRIFNAETTDVDVTLAFHSQGGGAPKTATMTIPAGQVRQLDGTLSSVFGLTNDGGAVHIATPSNRRLITTARTYNQTSNGTFGQFISGVTPAEAAGVGSRPLQLLQVEETARFRTNIGIAEVSGNAVRVEVAVVPPDSKFTAITEVVLGPNEFRQLTSILRSMGLADTYNARVTVKALDGSGRVTAYASVIDALTNDPTYIPAQ